METIYEAITPEEAEKLLKGPGYETAQICYVTNITPNTPKLPKVAVGFAVIPWDEYSGAETPDEIRAYFFAHMFRVEYSGPKFDYLDVYRYTRDKKLKQLLEENNLLDKVPEEDRIDKAVNELNEKNNYPKLTAVRIVLDYRGE